MKFGLGALWVVAGTTAVSACSETFVALIDEGGQGGDVSTEDGAGGVLFSSGGTSTFGGSSTGGTSSGLAGEGGAASGGRVSGAGGAEVLGTGTREARQFARKLGRRHFLVGMGSSLPSAFEDEVPYGFGVQLDLNYAPLRGLSGDGGWPDSPPGGGILNDLIEPALDHGVVPMFTLYGMDWWGDHNMEVTTDLAYMQSYWAGVQLLFRRLGEVDRPIVVHFEPDWWAFAQHAEPEPAEQAVRVKIVPDCALLPDSMVGMGKCLVLLARLYAPQALIGFHASAWADPNPEEIVAYLDKIGAAEADFVATDMADRDAGCYEVQAPECQRADGPWYWDATNTRTPNFHEHIAYAREIIEGLRLPLLWWQVPFGVPSGVPGGQPGHYRDNKLKYFFDHMDEFVEIGGVGVVFGVDVPGQTDPTTDGGQFQRSITNYYAAPLQL